GVTWAELSPAAPADTPKARACDGARVLGGSDQRFRGHAAGVETFASHLALLDQHHRYAEGGRGRGDREAAGARADDADIGLQTFRHAFSSRPVDAQGMTRIVDRAASRITHYPSALARPPSCARSRFTTTGMSARTPSAT